MPTRRTVLANKEVYHAYNRGVASLPIFKSKYDYQRFIELLDYYLYDDLTFSFSDYKKLSFELKKNEDKRLSRLSKVVEIFAYCLMPNHFHLLIKQNTDNGVQNYLRKVQNAYAKYFNTNKSRNGPLFQSRFKSKWIENDEVLLHVSRYIHLNPCTSFMIEVDNLSEYQWSSYPFYLGEVKRSLVDKNYVLRIISGGDQYQAFVENQAEYQRRLKVHPGVRT